MEQSIPKFQVYAKRRNGDKPLANIYLRVFYQKEIVDRSTGIQCSFKKWQSHTESIKGEPVLTSKLKEVKDTMIQKILGAFYILKKTAEIGSLKEVLFVAFGDKQSKVFSVYTCFEELIAKMVKAEGRGISKANIQKHKVCLTHLRTFVSQEYGWNDFPFDRINRTFVDGFVSYLKLEGGCAHNTTMKHLAIFKKVYKFAIDHQWVKHNAFSGFKMRLKIVDRAFLSEEEIENIKNKEISVKRLELIRDLFIFACYSGLAYIDLKNLRRANIEENLGVTWIKIKREKTGVGATIPLLGPARQILEKWNPNWHKQPVNEFLFTVPSNQKTNAYLKEIADICDITKPLSFHIGRHSFATSIALCNNISIETVSKMLGHSRISMTQHYSKVIDLKIAKDTTHLVEKFKN